MSRNVEPALKSTNLARQYDTVYTKYLIDISMLTTHQTSVLGSFKSVWLDVFCSRSEHYGIATVEVLW